MSIFYHSQTVESTSGRMNDIETSSSRSSFVITPVDRVLGLWPKKWQSIIESQLVIDCIIVTEIRITFLLSRVDWLSEDLLFIPFTHSNKIDWSGQEIFSLRHVSQSTIWPTLFYIYCQLNIYFKKGGGRIVYQEELNIDEWNVFTDVTVLWFR